MIFQSTPSAWRVTRPLPNWKGSCPRFQSTPSAWRVTDDTHELVDETGISIHTLRVEGDGAALVLPPTAPISIHTLRVEGDPMRWGTPPSEQKFQSTPSAWRVTVRARWGTPIKFISIHTLRVEGDIGLQQSTITAYISIHTLRVEGDVLLASSMLASTGNFNPHPPRGG